MDIFLLSHSGKSHIWPYKKQKYKHTCLHETVYLYGAHRQCISIRYISLPAHVVLVSTNRGSKTSCITCHHSTSLPPSLLHIRDVSSVELLQKYHQDIRSEIEARGAKYSDCMDLGKTMLTRKHRDSAEVRPTVSNDELLFILSWASDFRFH